MSETEENIPDRIYDNFLNKTIFISGGTGFVGKVVIERLLRVFDVQRVYILIRTKKDKDADERLQQIFSNPLFDTVRQLKGNQVFEKCRPISGDITAENMGIATENRIILQDEVEFVIHSAATVKFDEPLKLAIEINTTGTHKMLELAKGMKKLQIFVHVSTTYCHPEEKELHERIYKSPTDPKQIMDIVDWLKEDQLKALTPELLSDIPNTYTFSKALSEQLIANEMETLPVIIIRPSIVVPIWKDPIPGWIDNVNGPTGLLIAAGKGVLRSMYGNRDAYGDFVSVDAVADGIFCAVTHSMINGFPERIFHLCTSDDIKMKWGEVIDMGKTIAKEDVPFDTALWCPGGEIRSSKICHTLAVIFYHYLPALLIDGLAFCFGYQPFLWKIQKRISSGTKVLQYYTSNEWNFSNKNIKLLRNWLNAKERATYKIFVDGFNYRDYFTKCGHAARRYLLKEPDENLPKARFRMKVMYWLDKICNIPLKIFLLYWLYKYLLVHWF